MLGWRILSQGEYRLQIPILSEEEKGIIFQLQERFREVTRSVHAKDADESRKIIETLLLGIVRDNGLYLDRSQQSYLAETAFRHIYGFAFIETILEDNSVEEISVIGPNKPVYVYIRKQGWKSVNACFENEQAIADMINKMSRNLGRHITMQNPRLDAMLADGSRLHGSLPPVSSGEITIRRFRERPFSPCELVQNETIDAEAMAFLSILMQCDFSILIAGNTASGKTTTMNALFSFVPWNERVLITEETPEINIPHKHQLRLVANREMGILLKDLVYDSLRMRPDRMIVGEVRNKEEVEALLDVLLAGQARGSYATFHAQSTVEALTRLRSFGINENDVKSIDCIVIQRRMLVYDPKKRSTMEARRVVEIADVKNPEEKRVVYRHGHRFRPAEHDEHGTLLETAGESFGMNRSEMISELHRRKRLIESIDPNYDKFYEEIQKEFYGFGIGTKGMQEHGWRSITGGKCDG